MKRFAFFLATAATLVASCSTREENIDTLLKTDEIFYASFEQPKENGTKVFANENLLLRWTADDRVSIFNKITYNQEYKFTGQTGANSGGFKKVESDEFVTGNATSHVVSVYPYQESTEISESEELTVTLPAEQHYAEDTFGLGANTMVSVSSDNILQYKNVGGYLRLSLYGEGVSVSSITLKGNNGEKMAGKATITMPIEGMPSIMMAEDATDEITLICDNAISLPATADKSVDFWFVIPPVTMSKGFTVTIKGEKGTFIKSSEKAISIARSRLTKMSPAEIKMVPEQSNNRIYYTSTDGKIIYPNINNADSVVFGTKILSNEYIDGVGVLTLKGEISCIDDGAFSNKESLVSIVLPESINTIGASAFYFCPNLVSINIPQNVTSIGESAFWGCRSIKSLTLPERITRIESQLFYYCTSLSSIIIPQNVKSIGRGAFQMCYSLTDIQIPDSVTNLDIEVFRDCNNLTSIALSNNITSIGSSIFYRCESLSTIVIPESVKSIGNAAFSGCSALKELAIPVSVTSIGSYAFYQCNNLKSITIESSNPPSGASGMFNETKNSPIYVPSEGVETYKKAQYWSDYADRIQAIPTTHIISFADSSVKKRLVTAFDADNDGELSLVEAAAVTSGDDLKIAFGAIKTYRSFDEFQYFTGVSSIPNSMFENWNLLSSVILPNSIKSIGSNAFKGCIRIESLIIPETVKSIGSSAFQDCSVLRTILLSNNITTISSYLFSGCSNLTSISIPNKVTQIGQNAFYGCSSLTSIILPETISRINDYTFYNCSKLSLISIPSNVNAIGKYAFSNCINIPTIIIPENVTTIGDAAFANCSSLSSVTLEEGVSIIGKSAFSNCSNLSSISVPETLTSIGNSAFSGCSLLTEFTFYDSISSIGQNAFQNCTNLKSALLPESLSTIEAMTFRGCSNLTKVRIPGSISTIKGEAFLDCARITDLIIEEGVLSIEGWAFRNCRSLKELILPKSISIIGSNAFLSCNGLQRIIVQSDTPPQGDYGMLSDTNNCPIVVPNYSIYCNTDIWKDYFWRMVEEGQEPFEIKYNQPERIDLGLPSGRLWASFNVGASKPEDSGFYYSWGDIDIKDSFGWEDGFYKFGVSETIENQGIYTCHIYVKKYCNSSSYGYNNFVDNLNTLLSEDDAASINLGSSWRLPTYNDIMELKDNCDWEWGSLNGVNGYFVKSKTNSNSIFLPVNGYRNTAFTLTDSNSGFYWSSTRGNYPTQAWCLSLSSSSVEINGSFRRDRGCLIRPVFDD